MQPNLTPTTSVLTAVLIMQARETDSRFTNFWNKASRGGVWGASRSRCEPRSLVLRYTVFAGEYSLMVYATERTLCRAMQTQTCSSIRKREYYKYASRVLSLNYRASAVESWCAWIILKSTSGKTKLGSGSGERSEAGTKLASVKKELRFRELSRVQIYSCFSCALRQVFILSANSLARLGTRQRKKRLVCYNSCAFLTRKKAKRCVQILLSNLLHNWCWIEFKRREKVNLEFF